MGELPRVLVLVVAVAAVAGTARRFGWSPPILLVLVGLAVAPLPAVPTYHLDPEVVLVFFLPPLLYSAAIRSSLRDVRANARAIGLLSIGLVIFSTVAVGAVAAVVVPEISVPAALALGAIVSPPDAVAATSVARRLGLPDRAVTVLEGESLFNDATALVLYGVAVEAVVHGGVTAPVIAGRFALSILGGVLVGFAVAFVIARIRRCVDDPLLENTISLVTPFAAYLPAEAVHGSGVLAVVIAGLRLGHDAPVLMSSAARLQEYAIWSVIDFLLTGIVFALIGLQLPEIIGNLGGQDPTRVVVAAGAVALTAVLARIVWVFPATYLPRRLSRRIRERDPAPPWPLTFVLSWAGMRGVVSLGAAFALPLTTDAGGDFPGRDLILLITLVVIVVTLVGQGFTLPFIIRRARLRADTQARLLQEAAAQHRASAVAMERLDMLGTEDGIPPGVLERLRQAAEKRQLAAWERLGSGGGTHGRETPSAAYRRLRRELLLAERAELIRLRDTGHLSDEVLRDVLRDLDLEEALLSRE